MFWVAMEGGCTPRNYAHTPVGSAPSAQKLQKEQMNHSLMPEFCHLFNLLDKEVCYPEAASAIAYHRRYRAEPWTLDLPQVF